MSHRIEKEISDIDALLPQLQCGLCQHSGCRPYAKAIVTQNENINRCLPGGLDTLIALGQALNQDTTPFWDEMNEQYRPPLRAIIDENICIGCTKCIQACPTDAIIGTTKSMHTVLPDACTGCGLCVSPCPVDCIEMSPLPTPDAPLKKENADRWRARYQRRNERLVRQSHQEQADHQAAKLAQMNQPIHARKQAIQEALSRVNAKRMNKS